MKIDVITLDDGEYIDIFGEVKSTTGDEDYEREAGK